MITPESKKQTEINKAETKARDFTCGYFVFVFAAVLVLIIFAFRKIFPPEPIQPTDAQFVVVYPYWRGGKDPDIVAGVTLITDEEEIEEFNILAEQAKHGNHACGFNYGITFWLDETTIEKEKHLNYDCDIIKPALKRYLRKSFSDPTHYVYYLDIPAQITREDVINDFATLNLLVISSDPYANLPFITFHKEYYLSDEEGSLDALQDQMSTEVSIFINELDLSYPIVANSIDTDRNIIRNGSNGKIIDVILYFELGTDLCTISEDIIAAGYDSDGPEIPETYTIRLLVENPNPEEISTLVCENFDYVLKVRW